MDEKRKIDFQNMEIEWWNPDEMGNDTKRKLQFLLTHLKGTQKILEIAVGRGRFSFPLAMSDKNVVGIDINEGFIKICNEKKEKLKLSNLKFLTMDAENLSFPDNSFDACFCIDALLNCPNVDKAIFEMIRVTKHGGIIIFDFTNKFSIVYLKFLYLVKKGAYGINPPIWYYATLQNIRKMINKNDAQIEQITGIYAIPPNWETKYNIIYRMNYILEKLFPFTCTFCYLKIRKNESQMLGTPNRS